MNYSPCTRSEENPFTCKISLELCFFMKKKDEESPILFCMQLPFYMFSTLMSLEDRLRLKKHFLMYGYNAGPPMAIPIHTVLPYCVIPLLPIIRIHFQTNQAYIQCNSVVCILYSSNIKCAIITVDLCKYGHIHMYNAHQTTVTLRDER